MRLLHGLACWLVGRELALASVRFPYARPAHADDAYRQRIARTGRDLGAKPPGT